DGAVAEGAGESERAQAPLLLPDPEEAQRRRPRGVVRRLDGSQSVVGHGNTKRAAPERRATRIEPDDISAAGPGSTRPADAAAPRRGRPRRTASRETRSGPRARRDRRPCP